MANLRNRFFPFLAALLSVLAFTLPAVADIPHPAPEPTEFFKSVFAYPRYPYYINVGSSVTATITVQNHGNETIPGGELEVSLDLGRATVGQNQNSPHDPEHTWTIPYGSIKPKRSATFKVTFLASRVGGASLKVTPDAEGLNMANGGVSPAIVYKDANGNGRLDYPAEFPQVTEND
jgi:hypothetical protein